MTVEDPSSSSTPGPPRRRRVLWIGGVTVAVLALLVIGLFVVPGPLVRHLAVDYLEARGLDAQGFETLDIDLWNREVTIGPVAVGLTGAPPARLERLQLRFRLSDVLDGRIRFEAIVIRGIDVRVTRAADSALSVNQVPLSTFLPADAPPPEPTDDAADEPWHAGIDTFELRQSRVLFEDAEGRSVAMEIDGLDLAGFHSWAPDQAGDFALTGRVNAMEVRLRGQARPFADRITVTIDEQVAEIRLDRIEKAAGPLGLGEGDGVLTARFQRHVEVFPDGRITMSTDGSVEAEDVRLVHPDAGSLHLDAGLIALKVMLTVAADDTVSVTGELQAGVLRTRFDGGGVGVRLQDASVRLNDVSLTISGDGGLRFAGAPWLGVKGLALEKPVAATVASLRVHSPAASVAVGPDGRLAVEAAPTVSVREARVDGPAAASVEEAAVALESLNVQGGGDGLRIAAAGSADGTGFAVEVAEAGTTPAIAATLGALAARLEATAQVADGAPPQWRTKGEARLGQVGATVAAGEALSVTAEAVRLEEIEADQDLALAARQVVIETLEAEIGDRLWAAPDAGGEPPQDTGPATGDGPTEPAGLPFALDLGRFALEKGAVVRFADASVSPPVSATARIDALEVADLDTGTPDGRTTVNLAATVNEFTKVATGGWVRPFAEAPSFDLTGRIEGLELHPVSPYAARAVGMYLDSGRLTAEAAAKAEQGALAGELDVDVLGLEFKPLPPEDAARLSDTVGMPVETVVGLLEDGEGRIALTIPIAGTVAEPEFNLDDAIGQAVGGALAMLFPPAALVSLVGEVASGGGVTFKPLTFRANGTAVTVEGRSLADNLVHLLEERPRLVVKMCGRTTAEDHAIRLSRLTAQRRAEVMAARQAEAAAGPPGPETAGPAEGGRDAGMAPPPAPWEPNAEERAALDDQARRELAELAGARTIAAKRLLVERHGIDAGRLAECRPVFDAEDQGPPRVEVRL